VQESGEGGFMKFVVVNHAPPSQEAACSTCSQPLRSGYVRHVRTQRRYCDYDCYRKNQLMTLVMPWPMPDLAGTPATETVAAAARSAVDVIAVLGAVSCWSYTMQMWTLSRALTDAFLGANDLMMMEGGDG
jgi:hypothetical protein